MDQWEYMIGGGLGRGGEAGRVFVDTLTTEVCHALAEVHEAGVLHGDIALRNILVRKFSGRGLKSSTPVWNLDVMLIDFEHSQTRRAEERQTRGGIGDSEFIEACRNEMAGCTVAIRQWLP
jgi:serine/threonine protein kinase